MSAEESRLKIPASLRPPHEDDKLRGKLADGARRAAAGKLAGSLIEAGRKRERGDKIAAWRAVLEPGKCHLTLDTETSAVIARRDDLAVDVTELLVPGSTVIRRRPDGDEEWRALEIVPAAREYLPARLAIERGGDNAGRMSIGLNELMAPPNIDNGRSWEISVPTE